MTRLESPHFIRPGVSTRWKSRNMTEEKQKGADTKVKIESDSESEPLEPVTLHVYNRGANY